MTLRSFTENLDGVQVGATFSTGNFLLSHVCQQVSIYLIYIVSFFFIEPRNYAGALFHQKRYFFSSYFKNHSRKKDNTGGETMKNKMDERSIWGDL